MLRPATVRRTPESREENTRVPRNRNVVGAACCAPTGRDGAEKGRPYRAPLFSAGRRREIMKAIRIHSLGGPEVLQYEEVPDPVPGEGQALIRIAAAGVNFVDVYFRTGLYKG